jgi:hypothetical protein
MELSYCKDWWAGQDSNLQPDRYERPALTIELPARQPSKHLVSSKRKGGRRGAITPFSRCEAMAARWESARSEYSRS